MSFTPFVALVAPSSSNSKEPGGPAPLALYSRFTLAGVHHDRTVTIEGKYKLVVFAGFAEVVNQDGTVLGLASGFMNTRTWLFRRPAPYPVCLSPSVRKLRRQVIEMDTFTPSAYPGVV